MACCGTQWWAQLQQLAGFKLVPEPEPAAEPEPEPTAEPEPEPAAELGPEQLFLADSAKKWPALVLWRQQLVLARELELWHLAQLATESKG